MSLTSELFKNIGGLEKINVSTETLGSNIKTPKNAIPVSDEPNNTSPERREQPVPVIVPNRIKIIAINPSCSVIQTSDNEYECMIFDVIYNSRLYQPMINLLKSANETDIIKINIMTPGGNVDTGMRILDAMEICPGLILTNIISYAYSMGAMIWSYGDMLFINNGIVMYHNILMGAWDNINKLKVKAAIQQKLSEKLYKPIIDKGLLTENDTDYIFNKNKDLFMTKLEMQERIDKINNSKIELYNQLKEGAI